MVPLFTLDHLKSRWASPGFTSIERSIHTKWLTVIPVQVKGHDGNYWNDFANSLANSAHYSDTATLLPVARDNDYVVDWKLTWFSLNFTPVHDASFKASHASRHYAFKFKLFLDDLPLLEKLKITRPDLYIDLLTCRSCCDRKEDLMHLILCSNRPGKYAKVDPTLMLRKLSALSCWTISSSNWSSYALIRGCLPSVFIDLFAELSIPRQSAMKVVAAIYNNFIQKLCSRIWNLRTYDKSKWEDALNITLKLKTTPQPSNLPATSYVPFSSLLPPIHLVTSRDYGINWLKNSMIQGLPCGRVIRYYVSIVASTLVEIYQGEDLGKFSVK
ncbi:hypothetical protein GLOIN_2v1783661 [Rhizophagus clarus]|uniref:Uncharacterized protein n=2 Tax=Rhizophagus clarus TaxID=94130 RepID=A0A8H3LT35_9GLOM|nr:hypothetical protein GLOIN_2v1783661 [Rhizophagus clarus]